jgi:hypothetical protein
MDKLQRTLEIFSGKISALLFFLWLLSISVFTSCSINGNSYASRGKDYVLIKTIVNDSIMSAEIKSSDKRIATSYQLKYRKLSRRKYLVTMTMHNSENQERNDTIYISNRWLIQGGEKSIRYHLSHPRKLKRIPLYPIKF